MSGLELEPPAGDEARARARAIKVRRAEELARATTSASLVRGERYVVLEVGAERYALPLAPIEHIAPVPPLARLPGVPRFVEGVGSIGGQAVTVLDLAGLLGISRTSDAPGRRVVIVRFGVELVGLLVDGVGSITAFSEVRPLERVDAAGSWLAADQVEGIGDGAVAILRIERVLADPRVAVEQA